MAHNLSNFFLLYQKLQLTAIQQISKSGRSSHVFKDRINLHLPCYILLLPKFLFDGFFSWYVFVSIYRENPNQNKILTTLLDTSLIKSNTTCSLVYIKFGKQINKQFIKYGYSGTEKGVMRDSLSENRNCINSL